MIVVVSGLVLAAGWTVYAYTQGTGPVTWLCPGMRAQGMCTTSNPSCEPTEQCHPGTVCPTDGQTCPRFEDSDGDGKCDLVGTCERHKGNNCHVGAAQSGCAGMRGTHGCGRQ